ncbi:MAG: histidine phosphatase family protein [Patescibacteria group bacterium]
MGKIFIVRHGQDTDNVAKILNGRRDTELTDLGREQAKATAQKLAAAYSIKIIYSSPLKRCYETARIIAEFLHVDEIIVDEHLIEREFGILTGKPLADIPKYTDKILHSDGVNYFLEAEGTEDFSSAYERGKKILDEIKERHPQDNILIVTHGDTGKMIRAAFHDWGWEKGLMMPYFDNASVLELFNTQDIIN